MPESGSTAPRHTPRADMGRGDRRAKDALFDGLAGVAKALSMERRAELVGLLAQSERSVDELAGGIGQGLANTSHHLRVLLHTGLVQTRRDGNRIYYSLSSDQAGQLRRLIGLVARRHGERLGDLVAAYLDDRSGMTVIDRAELEARIAASHVVAHCRGPYCVYADQAVDHAVANGRAAARVVDGFPEWAAAGLPVETGAR